MSEMMSCGGLINEFWLEKYLIKKKEEKKDFWRNKEKKNNFLVKK